MQDLEREADARKDGPFVIPSTGPSSRPRRTLKHNDTFAIFDSHGDIGAAPGGPDGLFDADTRFLSHLEVRVNGAEPLLLGSSIKDDNLNLYVDLTNPDIYADGVIVLAKETIHIARTVCLQEGVLTERIAVVNHSEEAAALTLSITFGSDFSDLFEVRGIRRVRRGIVLEPEFEPAGPVVLSYRGLDDRLRETVLRFEPAPTSLSASAARYAFSLAPHERRSMFVAVSCRGRTGGSTLPFFRGLLAANRRRKAATRNVATIETSNRTLNEILCRSTADLYMLMTETPDGPYPYAGIPWYSTTFGRDGLITALEMLSFDPGIARGVLKRLAAFQADTFDASADAEPGKILHEMRGGEMAALREVPFGLYYGSADATPLFVLLAGLYAERTGDDRFLASLWPAIERALAWIDGAGDQDGDGFVEYAARTYQGLSNQGWKDSYDAVFHADGTLARGPIAIAEVQGYVYAAKRAAAACARRLGSRTRANALERQATKLRQRFEDSFWCEEIGMYALALDGEKRPCAVRSSNAGQMLFTGLPRPDRARRVADQLLSSRFNSGWGIRTIAKGEPRYNPMSYHNGSIWPHDNALIARGFARYGLKQHIEPVFHGMVQAANYMDQRRLPELFCGFRRRRGRGPTLYPVACSPQAWASATFFQLFEAMLGLRFEPDNDRVLLVDPRIPEVAGDVVIRNLRLGDSTIDLALRRSGGQCSVDVLRCAGTARVTLVPPENEARVALPDASTL